MSFAGYLVTHFTEKPLRYQLTYCCVSYPPPQHYENLITFYATKNYQLYYVVIGLFEK